MNSKLVFSTDRKSLDASNQKPSFKPSEGPVKIRLEKNGRGGKIVTVIFNLTFDAAAAKEHKQALQGKFGCGATMKEDRLELQGDFADRALAYFTDLGIKAKRAGG
jgi:translation initiation factor 1